MVLLGFAIKPNENVYNFVENLINGFNLEGKKMVLTL